MKMEENTLEMIGDVTLGTMTFENKTRSEKRTNNWPSRVKNSAFARSIPLRCTVPADATTQGKTDEYVGRWLKRQAEDLVVMTKVAGRSQMALRGRAEDEENRMTAKQMKEAWSAR